MSNLKKEIHLHRFLFLVSFLALAVALFAEYVLDMAPCAFCIYQRVPYFLLILVSISYLRLKKYEKIMYILAIVLLFVEVGLAFYHVGMERDIFAEAMTCKVEQFSDNLAASELAEIILEKTLPSCSHPVYLLSFISMAEMNLLFSFLVLVYSLFFIRRKYGHSR